MATNWKRIEVGLVLQGGGALGAYEWGAIEALFASMDDVAKQGLAIGLKVVTGVSIGAINGACIVGAKSRADGLRRLGALWNDLKLETPFAGRIDLGPFGLPDISPARDLSLFGLPGFYLPRTDIWNTLRWTSLYDTSPLKATLERHISFATIDQSDTTFVVTAVDVERGTLRRFRNKPIGESVSVKKAVEQTVEEQDQVVKPFEARHVIASGSLAPQFPWTEVDGRYYWDGGLVDNTPLGDAMDAFSEDDDVYRLLVVMNLYPLTARLPRNLLDVTDRVHELGYGNRLRQDRAMASRINKLVSAVRAARQDCIGRACCARSGPPGLHRVRTPVQDRQDRRNRSADDRCDAVADGRCRRPARFFTGNRRGAPPKRTHKRDSRAGSGPGR